MAKPNIEDTRWAVTALGVESPTQSDPDGTLKDGGYQDDDIPDPRDWNWWHRKAYAWFQYLNAGILSGDHTIAGAFTVGGQPLEFTDFTFTADHTTNTLIAAANPLDTGDGPVRPSNFGGALPTGLGAGTDYYWIRVDGDHGQLALSRSDALSGVIVSFSDDGSGTQTIHHQTGTTKVCDASVTRDLTVGRRLTIGSLTVGGEIYGVRSRQSIPTAWTSTGTAPTLVANPSTPLATPVLVWMIPSPNVVRARIPYEIGEIITAVKFEVFGDGTVDWTGNAAWNASSNGTGGATISSQSFTNEPATWTMRSLLTAEIGALTSGGDLYIELGVSNGTQIYFGAVELSVRRMP